MKTLTNLTQPQKIFTNIEYIDAMNKVHDDYYNVQLLSKNSLTIFLY